MREFCFLKNFKLNFIKNYYKKKEFVENSYALFYKIQKKMKKTIAKK